MIWETVRPAPDALFSSDRLGHGPRHRLQAALIAHAVWLYQRLALSVRGVAESLHERGIEATHETIRARVATFGAHRATELRRRAARPRRTWLLDVVFTRAVRNASPSHVHLRRA
jgi:transposase-like protein